MLQALSRTLQRVGPSLYRPYTDCPVYYVRMFVSSLWNNPFNIYAPL